MLKFIRHLALDPSFATDVHYITKGKLYEGAFL